MPNPDWTKVKDIFEQARQLDGDQRERYLGNACGDDDELLDEVRSLLDSLDQAKSFLQQPATVALAAESNGWRLKDGQQISHYVVLSPIAAGGMGEIYIAEDLNLRRKVALKTLHERLFQDPDQVRRFRREADAISALNHPNILTIYEFDFVDGTHFIAAEYVNGETLREKIKRGSLPVSEALEIAAQTAGALEAAHRAGVIHRDIKPENIMVRDDGYVKVLDFGLAKLHEIVPSVADTTAPTAFLTSPGMIMGTVSYMSPEQARGLDLDPRSDIFSLGVVLYEMISGRRPFEGNSTPESLANLINKQADPLDARVPGVTAELQTVVSKMLQKDRDDRYQTMRGLITELRELKDGHRSGSAFAPRAGSDSSNVTDVLPQTTGGGAITTAQTSAIFTAWHKRWQIELGILVLASLALGVFFGYRYFGSGGKQIDSIAVMPFVNESGDPQVEYLSDGMTDTLISSLSELPNVKVKARTSVFRYKGKDIDPKAVGKELGVEAIVNGRVTQRDGRTSVSLEVIDTETEDVIFSTRYDKPQSELVTLQSDIARDVSGKLKSKLSGDEEAKVTKTHTADPDALQLYLQGEFYRHKGGRPNVLRATEYFTKAVEKDPSYALAYASLALNYNSYYFYSITPPPDMGSKASAAAKRALELDDSLPEAHIAAGTFVGHAEEEFRRAIELKPDYAEAHDALCINLTNKKRFDEAIVECQKANELDPTSTIFVTDLGAAYFFARRFDESIEVLKRAHEMDPTFWLPLGWLGAPQMAKGQYTEAVDTFRKAVEFSDGSPNAKSHLAFALAKAGQRDEALKLIAELKRQAEHEHIATVHFAYAYIGLDKDEAFVWLEKAVDDGSVNFTQLEIHPWFDDLRTDPRFKPLLIRARQMA